VYEGSRELRIRFAMPTTLPRHRSGTVIELATSSRARNAAYLGSLDATKAAVSMLGVSSAWPLAATRPETPSPTRWRPDDMISRAAASSSGSRW